MPKETTAAHTCSSFLLPGRQIKLAKSAADSARPQIQAGELRDTPVPGFLCKVIPAGRRCSCSSNGPTLS